MAKQALTVVIATLLMGCLATDICADANLGTNLLQIVAATETPNCVPFKQNANIGWTGKEDVVPLGSEAGWMACQAVCISQAADSPPCAAWVYNYDGHCYSKYDTGLPIEYGGFSQNSDAGILCAQEATTVTASGDPHLKNIKKELFEVRRAGVHTLLNVPRGAAAVDALLKVGASVDRLESGCSSLFILGLDIMGQWLGSVPPLRFAAGSVLPGEVDGAVLQVGNSSDLSIDEFLSKVPASMIMLSVPKKDVAMPTVTNKHATLMKAALKF